MYNKSMNDNEYIKKMQKFHEELRADPVRLKAFMRKVMGPPSRTLEGSDKEHVMLLLNLTEPYKETNNQHSWTAYYNVGGKEYHVTYFPETDDPVIDEMFPEEE